MRGSVLPLLDVRFLTMHKRKSITSVLKSCVEHEWAIFVIYLNLLYQVTTDAKSMMHTCLIIHRVHVKIGNDYYIYMSEKKQRITNTESIN